MTIVGGPPVVALRATGERFEVLDMVVGLTGAFLLAGLAGLNSDDLRESGEALTLDRVSVRTVRQAYRKGHHGLRGYGWEDSLRAAINRSLLAPSAALAPLVDAVWALHRDVHRELGVTLDPSCDLGAAAALSNRSRETLFDEAELLRCVVLGNHHTAGRWPGRLAHLGRALGEDAWLWAAGLEAPVRLVDVLPHASAPRPGSRGDELDTGVGALPPELGVFYKADMLVGGVPVDEATATKLRGSSSRRVRTVFRSGRPSAWSAVSVKENVGEVEFGPGLHWAIARGSNASRKLKVTRHGGDPDLKVLRVPVLEPFLQANDLAFWALTQAFGGQVAKRQKPSTADPGLRESARRAVAALVEDALDLPAMELGWALLDRELSLDADRRALERVLAAADRRLHRERSSDGDRPWQRWSRAPRLLPIPWVDAGDGAARNTATA